MKMKSTHHVFRAVTLVIGLALLVVTGTAAMIGAFSGPVTAPGLYGPLASAPDKAPAYHAGDDSVLYERVARADGSYQWMLTEEPAATVASALPALGGSGFAHVSYELVARPAGLNRTMKNCSGSKSRAYAAYDLACNT